MADHTWSFSVLSVVERGAHRKGSTVLSGGGRTLEAAVAVPYALEDTVLWCVGVKEKPQLYRS